MADVPQLRQAFSEGADIHSMTAQDCSAKSPRHAASAKTINFAILYGISRWGLAGRLSITADEAQAMIDRYFDRFPGIRDYIHATLTSVRETGFTTTLFGRKTHFRGIKSKVQHERQGAERAAVNAPIQGHLRRHHQAGDGAHVPRAGGGRGSAARACCSRSMTNSSSKSRRRMRSGPAR
jgi:DNA polymerase-1